MWIRWPRKLRAQAYHDFIGFEVSDQFWKELLQRHIRSKCRASLFEWIWPSAAIATLFQPSFHGRPKWHGI